jgi:hypothetical protein
MPYGTIQADKIQGSINSFSPDSAMFRNRIINGAMVIDQRNAGASLAITNSVMTYTVDRWAIFENGSMAFSAQQSSTAPAGFTNSLLVTTATSASAGSTDRSQLEQRIEGLNVSDLGWGTANAKTITLSFWVRSSLTGQFGGALQNNNGSRAYPFSFTINSADTFEYKTITIVGDTSGTWLTTNGIGLAVIFDLGMGSSLLGTAGAWSSSDFRGATGDTKLSGTLNATLYLTGVQLEVGSTATSFDYRPYGTELQLCQRYYYNIFGTASDFQAFGCGVWLSSTVGKVLIDLPVPLRVVPTLEAASLRLFDAAASTTRSATGFSIAYTVTPTNKAFIDVSVGSSSASAGDACLAVLNTSTSARVGFSAEL